MNKLKIFNSLSNKKEVFYPIDKNNIRVYACGPTVYNYAHIGNARMAVVFDTVVKFLRYIYPKITYVSNITDIDDKIIKKSLEEKVSCKKISDTYLNIYNYEMKKINVESPDFQPKATDYVDSMIKKIKTLQDKGYAYFKEGHLLFSVSGFPKYGALSKRNKEDQMAGSRVEVASYKKNPSDFVLWKPSKKSEPAWDSPWGLGRPGWHTECFAMASDILKTPFDIHAGGLDLKFPHHDNEIAQSCCFKNKNDDIQSYAKYWMHNGFVTLEEKKMSKSLGNIKLLKDYLKNYNGEIIRLALLCSHYRSPLVWSDSLLNQSKNILDKFYEILLRLDNVRLESKNVKKLPDELENYFFDDFNLAKVFTYLNKIIKNKENFKSDENKTRIKSILLKTGNILGIFRQEPSSWFNKDKKVNSEKLLKIKNLIEKRDLARKEKNFKLADEIRNKILDLGVEVKDGRGGVEWNWIK